jgi:hypothetical protein
VFEREEEDVEEDADVLTKFLSSFLLIFFDFTCFVCNLCENKNKQKTNVLKEKKGFL